MTLNDYSLVSLAQKVDSLHYHKKLHLEIPMVDISPPSIWSSSISTYLALSSSFSKFDNGLPCRFS
jgi:hypothetical protein